jgi:glycosyltransferase involved in cell wall biosynthesis
MVRSRGLGGLALPGFPFLPRDVGGARDIVAPQAGFLVLAADSDALADRLTVIVDDPECWPDMGRAGRTTATDGRVCSRWTGAAR